MDSNNVLLLFDIDGTLVQGARCHYMAFVHSVKRFYGLEGDISGINYAGKTDPQILREVLEMQGVSREDSDLNFQNCLNYMVEYYLAHVRYENSQALGGVKNLLNKLKIDNILVGLVTGNLEPIAYAKLRRAGLDGFFYFGGFGSDHIKRVCLVEKAIERARKNFSYNGDNIFVIGDTPRDIEAAKPFKLNTIGVATGRYSVKELEKTGATIVLENLEDSGKFFKIISEVH